MQCHDLEKLFPCYQGLGTARAGHGMFAVTLEPFLVTGVCFCSFKTAITQLVVTLPDCTTCGHVTWQHNVKSGYLTLLLVALHDCKLCPRSFVVQLVVTLPDCKTATYFLSEISITSQSTDFDINSLTNAIRRSPSPEANSFSATQEIPGILCSPKVHFRVPTDHRWQYTVSTVTNNCIFICW